MKWLIALVLAACPAPQPAPQAPAPGAPTGPPGEVIGHGDPPPDDRPDDRGPDDRDDRDDRDRFDAPAPEPEPAPARPTAPARPRDPEPAKLRGILRAHNQARAGHCAAPLSWSRKLAAVAQRWADTLAGRGCAFEHSPGTRFGENLAFASPAGTHTPKTTTAAWYREVKLYDFSNPRFSFEAGHFTQVVWRQTTKLGCGYAACANGAAEIWVCNYDPAGNVSRSFRENVRPSSCKK